jgi:hypothetical protein
MRFEAILLGLRSSGKHFCWEQMNMKPFIPIETSSGRDLFHVTISRQFWPISCHPRLALIQSKFQTVRCQSAFQTPGKNQCSPSCRHSENQRLWPPILPREDRLVPKCYLPSLLLGSAAPRSDSRDLDGFSDVVSQGQESGISASAMTSAPLTSELGSKESCCKI